MNITDNLIRIKEGKDNIIKSLKNKGVSIADNTLINEIPTIIDNAEIGGGGSDTPVQPEIPELVQKYEGASVFRINVPEDNYEFAINLCNDATKATYDVDWGDGTLEYGLTTDEQHHTYSKAGVYDVNIYNLSKNITLGGKYEIRKQTLYSNASSQIIDTYIYLFLNTNNIVREYYNNNNTYVNNDCINIKIGDNIKLGLYSFKDCNSLTSIEITSSVTSIGEYAFYDCSSLTSLILNEGLISIGQYAFYGCSSLTSINIPETVTSIGNRAFQGCNSLTSINIPNLVTSLEDSTFSGCSRLTDITIPETVTSIGNYAFNGCSSLTSINIPETVTSIGNRAFYGCSSLTSINIPETVTSIGEYAFQGCSSLQSVVIHSEITKLFNNTFAECSSLQSVELPNTLTTIDNYVFNNCYMLNELIILNPIAPTITSNLGNTSTISIRTIYTVDGSTGYDSGNWDTYFIQKGWTIKSISEKPIEKQPCEIIYSLINNINIPILNEIGNAKLLENYKEGEEFYLKYDDKINSIPSTFFQGEKLTRITLPNTLVYIYGNTFKYCTDLTEVNIPENVTGIGFSSFYGCSNLSTITIPSSVLCLELNSFRDCYNLSTITCKAIQPPTLIGTTVFSSVGSKVPSGTKKVLRVPEGSDYSTWLSQLSGFTIEYIPLSEL